MIHDTNSNLLHLGWIWQDTFSNKYEFYISFHISDILYILQYILFPIKYFLTYN